MEAQRLGAPPEATNGEESRMLAPVLRQALLDRPEVIHELARARVASRLAGVGGAKPCGDEPQEHPVAHAAVSRRHFFQDLGEASGQRGGALIDLVRPTDAPGALAELTGQNLDVGQVACEHQ
jgi:hypothetical protein